MLLWPLLPTRAMEFQAVSIPLKQDSPREKRRELTKASVAGN